MITPELSHQSLESLVSLAPALMMAFGRPTRRQILERDGHKSVLSGKREHLEAAHIDHSRTNPRYNDASNGRTLTTAEHFWDHVNRHGRNGLTESQNNFAIITIWKRFWGIR